MTPLLLLVAAVAAQAQSNPPVLVTPVTPAPSTPVAAPPIRIAPTSERWPSTPSGKPVSGPDWSDYRLYPPKALDLDQQGRVAVEALVGADGVPQACRILGSSGYAELDTGTCDLMNLLRFSPPRDAAGRPVESVYRRAFLWLTSDPTPFAPAGMTVRLRLGYGAVADCRQEPRGDVPPEWPKLACRTISQELNYYLAGKNLLAARATVEFDVVPAGTPAPQGDGRTPVAEWRSEFGLAPNGDLRDCRVIVNRGFGPPPENEQSPCGFFMTRTWFAPAAPPAPTSGTFSLRVYTDR